MDLREFGATLRHERETKGKSLDEAVAATKIGRRNLEVLEEGLGEEMPHATYAKGFVKTYAKWLDLDPEATAASFMQARGLGSDEEEIDLARIRSHSEQTAAINTSLPSGGEPDGLADRAGPALRAVAGVALFIGALMALGWGGREVFNRLPDDYKPAFLREQQASEPAAPGTQAGQQPSTPNASSAAPQNGNHSKPPHGLTLGAPAAGNGQPPADAAHPPVSQTPPPMPVPDKPGEHAGPATPVRPEAVAEQKPEAAAESPKVDRVLVIAAKAECWVRYAADGAKKISKATLQPGETLTVRFKKSLELKVGNAGGVSLTLDGQQRPTLGKSGEVVSVRLP